MVAARAAYSGGEEWLNQCVSYIDGNHDFVQAYFKSNGNIAGLMKVPAKPEGTYLTWLDVTGLADKIGAQQMAMEARKAKTGPDSITPPSPEKMVERWLARNAGVALVAGTSFGKGSDNHMRMNIATSRRTLKAALDAISDACKRA
jgi:cystathionine beta-lyase